MSKFVVRLRSRLGMWRMAVTTRMCVGELKQQAAAEHGVDPERMVIKQEGVPGRPGEVVENYEHLGNLGIQNGDILFLELPRDAVDTGAELEHRRYKRVVDASGNVSFVPDEEAEARLRDQKMTWKYSEFCDLMAKKEIHVKPQKEVHSKGCALAMNAANNYQAYCQQIAFSTKQWGFLYGRVNKQEEVEVECIFECGSVQSFAELELPTFAEDGTLEKMPNYSGSTTARNIAMALGLDCVGFVFCHARREGNTLTSEEIVFAGNMQKAYGNHFVTLKAFPTEAGETHFEAFQISDLGVDLLSQRALFPHPENNHHLVCAKERSLFVEMKPAQEVDNDMFILTVPIGGREGVLGTDFPVHNRMTPPPTNEDMKKVILSAPKGRLTEALCDFQILYFLRHLLGEGEDMTVICEAIREFDDSKLLEYPFLIRSLVGLEG